MTFTTIQEDSIRKVADIDGSHKSIYIKSEDKNKENNIYDISIDADDDRHKFIPYFPKIDKQNWRIVISAPSGAGKSVLANSILDSLTMCVEKSEKIIKSDDEEIPDEIIQIPKIFLFTNLVDDDPAYKESYHGRNLKKVVISNEILELKLDDFRDCIVIFDDYECRDRSLNEGVLHLIDILLTQSRKRNVHIVTIIHDLKMHQKTKMINTESNVVIIFPNHSNHQQIDSYLKTYIGFGKRQIRDIVDNPSRWVCINKYFPWVCISEKRIYFPMKFQ